MTPLRFFTDEDVHRAIAARLRAAGFDSGSKSFERTMIHRN